MQRVVLFRLWLLTAAFLSVAIARSVAVGIPLRDPGNRLFSSRLAMTAILFVGFVLLEALVRSRRGERRPAQLWLAVRCRWTPSRLAGAGLALLAYHVIYVTYRNLKSWDVLNTPRDGALTEVDFWLFLGHSPAVLLHDLLGQHVAAHALITVYETFPTLVVLVVAGSVFTSRLLDGISVLASLAWVWILGTASYYAIPSLGPFSDRPQDFAGLSETTATTTQSLYLEQRLHLLAQPGAADAFASVSAFASLHVGVTTVITLMAARLGFRRAAWVLRVFLALTCVATVYLGWHFAVDLPAGLFLGWLAVRLGVAMCGDARSEVAVDPSRGREKRLRT